MTCAYISRCDVQPTFFSPTEFNRFFENGWDLGRSLWDRDLLLFHLDIEYVNFDYLAEPYLDLQRSFALQEPVIQVVRDILARFDIQALQLMSGRGYHFIWQIPLESPETQQLVEWAHVSSNLEKRYASVYVDSNASISEQLAKAYSGQALVMEYLAHLIKEKAAPQSEVPVEITAVNVGPGQRGREMISIDISEYGDPLHTRMIRVPFSPYLKTSVQHHIRGVMSPEQLPALFMLPVQTGSLIDAVNRMQDEQQILHAAQQQSIKIPTLIDGTRQLIQDYAKSNLFEFHQWFYSQEQHEAADWAETYDVFAYDSLPTCVAQLCQNPNDTLQKPGCIQLLTRTLLALGWHPRHIAGFIRSKYERNYGWGNYWYEYDAALRADFYVRLFTGLFAVGRDDLVDFNSVSTREKGIASHADCYLYPFKQSLLNRRKHEQLGCRPFNRLLL